MSALLCVSYFFAVSPQLDTAILYEIPYFYDKIVFLLT